MKVTYELCGLLKDMKHNQTLHKLVELVSTYFDSYLNYVEMFDVQKWINTTKNANSMHTVQLKHNFNKKEN